jgi:hypothetical protein
LEALAVAVAEELLEEREDLEEPEDPRRMARRALLGPMGLEEPEDWEESEELVAMVCPEPMGMRERIHRRRARTDKLEDTAEPEGMAAQAEREELEAESQPAGWMAMEGMLELAVVEAMAERVATATMEF